MNDCTAAISSVCRKMYSDDKPKYWALIDRVIDGRDDSSESIKVLTKAFKALFLNSTPDKYIKQSFKYFFSKAKPEILDDFLNQIALSGLKEKNLGLHDYALTFLSYDKLQEIFAIKEQQMKGGYKKIETLASDIGNYFNTPENSKAKRSLLTKIKQNFSFIINFIPNIINTFLIAFSLKDPQSVFEVSTLLDIYYKFFMIPSVAVVVLGVLVPFVGLKLYAITAAVIALCSVLLFVYVKWLRPCPSRLPYCNNLTEDAKRGRFPAVVGRDDEIRKLMMRFSSLDSTVSKHVILVGPSGVGKTEIVKGFAQKIAFGGKSIPQNLKNKKIFVINSAELVQGGKLGYANQLNYLLDRVKGYENEVIFFFEEIHTVFKNKDYSSLSDFLKVMLDRGKIHCIASTTSEEFDEYIKNDLAFNRRFKKMHIRGMDDNTVGKDTLVEVLQALIRESVDSVCVDGGIIEKIIDKTNQMAKKYLQNEKKNSELQQPAFAVTVLTDAMSVVSASTDFSADPPKLVELKAKFNRLKESMSSDPDLFPTTPQGRVLLNDLVQLDKEIKAAESALIEERRKVAYFKKLFQELKTRKAELKRSAARASRSSNKHLLKEFYWKYAYIIPQLQKILEKVKSQIPGDHIKLSVDEKLIDELLFEIEKRYKN